VWKKGKNSLEGRGFFRVREEKSQRRTNLRSLGDLNFLFQKGFFIKEAELSGQNAALTYVAKRKREGETPSHATEGGASSKKGEKKVSGLSGGRILPSEKKVTYPDEEREMQGEVKREGKKAVLAVGGAIQEREEKAKETPHKEKKYPSSVLSHRSKGGSFTAEREERKKKQVQKKEAKEELT